MSSLQGKLLLASPAMDDPTFGQAVVLMVEHGSEGGLGLVLNRPTQVLVREVLPEEVLAELGEAAWSGGALASAALREGGPCRGPLMLLHGLASASQVEVLPGVHFATQQDLVELALSELDGERMLCFAGYSGWGQGQLEDELAEEAWLVLPAEAELVFGVNDRSWSEAVRGLSRAALREALPPNIVPDDPSLN